MKKYLSIILIAFLASAGLSLAGPDTATMEAREKEAWQAAKDKDEAGFGKVVDKDVRCVYDTGIVTMSEELASIKSSDVKSFSISDYKIFSDEKDVVVATYTVKLEGTADGKDASGTYNAGTVWKEENGQWMAIFHTQIKAAPKS